MTSPETSNGSGTILVVDDEPDMRDFLSMVLEDHGFACETARDGVEALEKIRARPPALLALDVSMPRMSGYAVYRKIKLDEDLKSIPVIFITGAPEELRTFLSNREQIPPPEAYMPKPIEYESFLACVRRLLAIAE